VQPSYAHPFLVPSRPVRGQRGKRRPQRLLFAAQCHLFSSPRISHPHDTSTSLSCEGRCRVLERNGHTPQIHRLPGALRRFFRHLSLSLGGGSAAEAPARPPKPETPPRAPDQPTGRATQSTAFSVGFPGWMKSRGGNLRTVCWSASLVLANYLSRVRREQVGRCCVAGNETTVNLRTVSLQVCLHFRGSLEHAPRI
jgi:hypothetical protein